MYDRPCLVKIAGVTYKIEHSTQLSYSIAQFIFTCDLQACTKTMPVNVSVLGKKPISSWLACGSHGACLDCVLPGVQVTAGLGFLSALKSFML